jgi:hypothetical protein
VGYLSGQALAIAAKIEWGKHDTRPTTPCDAVEPMVGLVRSGRVGRDSDEAGIEAAKQTNQELKPRRVAQQGPLARSYAVAQHRGHGPGPAVEVGERKNLLTAVSLREMAKATPRDPAGRGEPGPVRARREDAARRWPCTPGAHATGLAERASVSTATEQIDQGLDISR